MIINNLELAMHSSPCTTYYYYGTLYYHALEYVVSFNRRLWLSAISVAHSYSYSIACRYNCKKGRMRLQASNDELAINIVYCYDFQLVESGAWNSTFFSCNIRQNFSQMFLFNLHALKLWKSQFLGSQTKSDPLFYHCGNSASWA